MTFRRIGNRPAGRGQLPHREREPRNKTERLTRAILKHILPAPRETNLEAADL